MSGHYYLLAKARDINAAAEAVAKDAEKAAADAKKTETARQLESLLDAIPASPQLLPSASPKPEGSYHDGGGVAASSDNAGLGETEDGSGDRVENDSDHADPENALSNGDGKNTLSGDDEKREPRRTRCAESHTMVVWLSTGLPRTPRTNASSKLFHHYFFVILRERIGFFLRMRKRVTLAPYFPVLAGFVKIEARFLVSSERFFPFSDDGCVDGGVLR